MTRGQLLNLLTKEAKKYHREALSSIERNRYMNNLSPTDLSGLKKNRKLAQRMIAAVLVDFINTVGVGQCVNYGLHTKHLKFADRT